MIKSNNLSLPLLTLNNLNGFNGDTNHRNYNKQRNDQKTKSNWTTTTTMACFSSLAVGFAGYISFKHCKYYDFLLFIYVFIYDSCSEVVSQKSEPRGKIVFSNFCFQTFQIFG